MKILHVDDDPKILSLVAALLQSGGHVVISTPNLESAKTKLAQDPQIKLIITDGFIQAQNDGIAWAVELFDAQKPVLILSGGRVPEYIPALDKGRLNRINLLAAIGSFPPWEG